jgi:hypothetical protein
MVIIAEQFQKEFDEYLVTPEDERNFSTETVKLNEYVLVESKGFFERMLGTAMPVNKNPSPVG